METSPIVDDQIIYWELDCCTKRKKWPVECLKLVEPTPFGIIARTYIWIHGWHIGIYVIVIGMHMMLDIVVDAPGGSSISPCRLNEIVQGGRQRREPLALIQMPTTVMSSMEDVKEV